MLSQTLRPQDFNSLAGQSLVKTTLQAIVRNPDKAPRSIILSGPFGTGKSTSARILGKALNCPNKDKNMNPCNKADCPICSQDINACSFYDEYDSSVVGNVETIRELRDTFHYTIEGMYRVIVMDEIQEASSKAQGALLKVLEEAPQGIFFVFATTHPHKLIPTILSRSLEIKLQGVSIADIENNIRNHMVNLNLEVDENVIKTIAQKSQGHMRNAHMLLDLYSLIGLEAFKESVKSARASLIQYFLSIATKNKAILFKALDELQTFPVANIKDDYENLLLDLMKALIDKDDSQLSKLAQGLNTNLLKIVRQSSEQWFSSSFYNDVSMTTALMALWQLITQATANKGTTNIRTK